jgi:uncharacterized protein (TIGR02145 family)
MKRCLFYVIILVSVVLYSCSKDEETAVVSYPTVNSSFFAMENVLVQGVEPCVVHSLFFVTDNNANAVDSLCIDDFVVEEDGMAVDLEANNGTLKGYAESNFKVKTILLINTNEEGGVPLEKLKSAAKAFLNNVSPMHEIAILGFDDEVVELHGFSSDRTSLINVVNELVQTEGEREVYASVDYAVKLMEDKYSTEFVEQSFLVVLSTGNSTENSSSGVAVSEVLADLKTKKTLCVSVASSEGMSIDNIGTVGYFEADNTDEYDQMAIDANDRFRSFLGSFYWLSYYSSLRDKEEHTVEVSIVNNSNGSENSSIQGGFSAEKFFTAVKSVVINNGETYRKLNKGDSYTLTAKTWMANTNPQYVWSSSNSSIVSISVVDNSNDVVISGVGQPGEKANIKVQDVANNMEATLEVEIMDIDFVAFTDARDGKQYNTVEIGDQTWLAENINYEVAGKSWLYDNMQSNSSIGRLYTYEGAKQACPDGWHLPSDEEWKALESFLGMDNVNDMQWRGTNQGHLLKSSTGWDGNNQGADEYGFAALAAGMRLPDGNFDLKGESAFFWTATELTAGYAYSRMFVGNNKGVYRDHKGETFGFSVRCVKDL